MQIFSKNISNDPTIIGVCGRTCSGKGALTTVLASMNRKILLLQADCYFTKSIPYKGYQSWEHTQCLAVDRLIQDISALKNGEGTTIKIETPWMPQINLEIFSSDIKIKRMVILDGYLIFAIKELVDLIDYKLFIDVSDYNLLVRRLKRNGFEQFNQIVDVIVPVSKEYEYIQKKSADIIVDGNKTQKEVVENSISFLKEKNLQINQTPGTWRVKPGDLISDHEWHPIDFKDLKIWVRDRKEELETGKELKGHTFRYRKNFGTGDYEIRLSSVFPIFRYTLEPT